ncbi:hypothetical protein BGY98DRAFT_935991 [Russula aff. rugulosa BPL654]|nr:hypothetical protein BGY98DRAFT_935991 [Russula aff. rugulosa BPL654]
MALDASPHEDQAESIKILERLDKLIDKYPNINITFLWLPKKPQFIGFQRTRQLALEAVRTADLTNFNEPQTLNNQAQQAERAAIAAWEARSRFYRGVTQRFFPLHTPDQVACQCGEPIQTVEHVIMHCPYSQTRASNLTQRPHTKPQTTLETPKRVQMLLRFIERRGPAINRGQSGNQTEAQGLLFRGGATPATPT